MFAVPSADFAGEDLNEAAFVEYDLDAADTSEDGVLSADEYAEARSSDCGLTFEQSETIRDGSLTSGE